MRRVYEFSNALLTVLILAVTSPLLAQLTLVSSQPDDGDVNVATPATFVLTFSAPLDTSARFDEPENFFLGILIFPEDSTGEPGNIELSQDLRTVTVSGFPITPDTRITILVTGAKSQAGDLLDRPYIITFSTGSSLPAGSFSGQVDFPGSDPSGAVVVLFGETLFEGDPVAAGVANSPYTVNYVPDGTYFPMALKDTNGEGIDPGSGDAIGFYDADGDQQPDPIIISGGNSVSGVDIEMFQPSPQTARNNFDAAESAAFDWADDAQLVLVNGRIDSETGESYNWFYGFYSKTLAQFNAFMLFGDLVVASGLKDDETPDTSAVRVDWMDSDEALEWSLENGGDDFLLENPDAEIFASLAVPSNLQNSHIAKANKGKWFGDSHTNWLNSATRSGSGQVVWYINYFNQGTFEGFGVAIDAVTGEQVILGLTAASDNVDLALQSAANWMNDAQLINIQTWGLYADGLAFEWRFGFYSASRDSVRRISIVHGEIVHEFMESKDYQPSLEALPQNWINSPNAATVAEQNSSNFRGLYLDTFVDGFLSRGLLGDNRAIWRFHYNSVGSQQSLEIFVDAVTGDIATGVEDGSPIVPTVFELGQNYPNPFNPETVIQYSIAKSGMVELTVYNLLGQNVRRLVDKLQPAGAYEMKWDGRDDSGKRLGNGVYIYRLKSAELTQTKKMILLQ